MKIKLHMKPILIGLLVMFILSIPMGYIVSQVHEYLLSMNGLSYKHSDINRISEVLSRYDFHPYVIGAHLISSLVTVSVPSFVVARMARDNKIINGMIMGAVSILLFIYWSNLDVIDNIKYTFFIILLNMMAALFGAVIGRRFYNLPKKRD